MTVRSTGLFALCGALAAMLAACSDDSPQVITGRFELSRGALAVRAITDDNVVTATPVRTDGSFTITLPAGSTYRLEVLTRTGVKNIVMRSGNVLRDLSFKVCEPQDPFDVGDVGEPNTDGLCMPGDENCTPCDPMTGVACDEPPKECQPDDPNCAPGCDPTIDPSCGGMCDPVTDPNCGGGCDPNDPTCGSMCTQDGVCCYDDGTCCKPDGNGGEVCCFADGTCCYADGTCTPPPTCQPGDPNCCSDPNGCEPPSCDPAIDPMCCYADGSCPPPPTCDPTIDPYCDCNATGTCGCTDMNDPNCGGVPPCENPMDPSTCKDPCIEDPAQCGCTTPDCWTEPEPCCDANGMCDPGDGMEPDNVPTDFGCE